MCRCMQWAANAQRFPVQAIRSLLTLLGKIEETQIFGASKIVRTTE